MSHEQVKKHTIKCFRSVTYHLSIFTMASVDACKCDHTPFLSRLEKSYWSLCLLFFNFFFFFFTKWLTLQKLWKVFFISSKKLFTFSRYSNFCNFFSSFLHFPDAKGEMKVEWFMMSWIGLHKFADVIFGIIQKLLYITSSYLAR